MINKEFYRIYELTDGRYIVTPRNLNYALHPEYAKLFPSQIRQDDLLVSSIVPNAFLADILQKTLREKNWKPAEIVISGTAEKYPSEPVDYCLALNNELYIYAKRGKYEPLDSFVETASKAELQDALSIVANYAAYCQASLAKIASEKKRKAN